MDSHDWQIILKELSCPMATQDLMFNTKNRDAAVKNPNIKYGPLNLSDEKYWEEYGKRWNTTAEVAKKSNCSNCIAFDISPRMEKCMPLELDDDGRFVLVVLYKCKIIVKKYNVDHNPNPTCFFSLSPSYFCVFVWCTSQ